MSRKGLGESDGAVAGGEPATTAEEVRDRVLARAGERAGELAANIADSLAREPSFATLADPAKAAVEEAVAASVPIYLRVVGERRRLRQGERAAIEQLVYALAETGLDDDELGERMAGASEEVWRFVTRLAGEVPAETGVAVEALGRLLADSMRFFADVRTPVAAAYRRRRDEQLAALTKGRQDLVDELLHGPADDDAELLAQAERLGYDVAAPLGLLVVGTTRGRRPAERLRTLTAGLLAQVPAALEGSLRAQPSPHAVVLVPAPAAWDDAVAAAEALCEHGTVVVAARPLGDRRRLPAAYAEAVACLPLAARRRGEGVVRLEDLATERAAAALGSLDAHVALCPALEDLLALPVPRRERLVATLEALWCEEGNAARAGDRLQVSERTVRRAVDEIKEVTGLDARRPRDRWQLDTARYALRVFGEA